MPYIYTVDSNAARNNNKIDINVGNTLAVRLTGKGGTIGQLSPYQAADPTGAYPFCLLYFGKTFVSLFWLFPTRPQSHFTNEQNMYQGDNNNLNHSIYTDINKYLF